MTVFAADPTASTPGSSQAPVTELRTEHLTLGYEKRIVVEDLQLTFPIGRITAVVGPNGSGKSTIVRATARLLRPRAGVVLLDGKAVARMPTKEVARRLAVLPQGPSSPEGLTVERLVWNGRYPHQGFLGTSTEHDADAVHWALRQTHMEEFADRTLDALSGGERQRAWIAMALAQQTPILLLDEPTTFLDLGHQLEVLELLTELNANQGMTVIMVLHELNQAARYSDYMVAVSHGRIWSQGTPTEVMTRELLEQVFGVHAEVLIEPGSGKPYCVPTSRADQPAEPAESGVAPARQPD